MKKFSLRSMMLCALFAALICVGAFIRIPMPAVPFTLQTMFVLMAGSLLGSGAGAASALIYMLLGLLGLPVFTAGGGLGYVLRPSFGYILGFVPGAYIAGKLSFRRLRSQYMRVLFASITGLLVIYAFGMIYYWLLCVFYLHTQIGFWPLLLNFFIIFLPGDTAMCFVGALATVRLRPALV